MVAASRRPPSGCATDANCTFTPPRDWDFENLKHLMFVVQYAPSKESPVEQNVTKTLSKCYTPQSEHYGLLGDRQILGTATEKP